MTKKIWITGASSGIGRALAIKFAKEGWQVAASARREKLLNDLRGQNSNIFSFPLDVKDEIAAKNVFENIAKSLKSDGHLIIDFFNSEKVINQIK